MTFLPFTHTTYTFISHKRKECYIQREKTLDRFLQHNILTFLERELLILKREIIVVSSPSLSYCHTLKGDLYPNTTHTFSECRECFGAQKALGIFQENQLRLGGCNRVYCEIHKTSEDKTSRNPLVAKTWRAQIHWVNQAWRVFCHSCTPTYSLEDRFRLGGSRIGFSPSSSVSSLIICLGIILCFHLSSLTLVLYIYCLLFIFVHNSSFGDYVSFTLVCTQISQGKSNLAVILKLGLNKLVCFSTNLSFQILAFCFIQFNVSRLFIPHTYS